jgi:DNA-binding CsgD family transcriptional regulator
MPGPLVSPAPFHRGTDEDLDRLVATVGSALDPDTIELAFRFVPEDRHFRRRFARGAPSTVRTARKPAEPRDGEFALRTAFHVPDLVEGQLTLLRRIRRPWTGAERLRFALLQPLLAQILECAARREADAAARRWLLAAAERAEAPILLLDASGAILFANAAAHALLGRQPEEMLAVFCGDGRSIPLLSHLERLASSASTCRHERLALTNGRSLEAWIALVDDGGPLRVVTLNERAGLTLEDVRPHLVARGVSERETDVVGCVLQGMRNAEIARVLFISEYTVKDHLKHVFAKLSVSSRGDLVCALHALPRTGRKEAPQPHSLEGGTRSDLKM